MTRWCLIAMAVLMLSCGRSSHLPQPSTNTQGKPWRAGETYTLPEGRHHPPFEISTWGSDDGYHLVGHFVYRARRYPRDHPVSTLHGKQRDGWFWPNVTLQVSPNCRDSWKTIQTVREGEETLQMDASNGVAGLTVRFEPFKVWIGKAECGRVLLESGEAESISLSALVPPPQTPAAR